MSIRRTLATSRRILQQLEHDRRTVVMIIVAPLLLMIVLRYAMNSADRFSGVAPAMLGIFPFVMMFLVTSVATLRERTTGTLERLMTMPMGKLDLLVGYALAFAILAVVEVAAVALLSVTWLGLDIAGSIAMLLLVAVMGALLGVALGLLVSAFARTEFQAVQFLPAIVLPQVLLCGLFVPRASMATALRWISDVLPLSYAVRALDSVTRSDAVGRQLVGDLMILVGATLAALVLAAATLRRRTG